MKRALIILLLALVASVVQAQQHDTCRSKDIPAPTIGDLDPANRHTACIYSGIALAGTPSQPNYSLVWEPVCPSATPQSYSGDTVTISYMGEVCDVRVYYYDRERQCRSADYYVHTVDYLEPAPLNIPQEITVCPGTVITWGDDDVPDQSFEGMLYEWAIGKNQQYCASVQGSQFVNGIRLVVNEVPSPTTFYVRLERTFCSLLANDYIVITADSTAQGPWSKASTNMERSNLAVTGVDCPSLPEGTAASITTANAANPNRTCDNTPIRLTAQLNYPGSIVSAVWDFGDGSTLHATGDHVYHTFREMATYKVTATVTDDRGCTVTSAPLLISSESNLLERGFLMRMAGFSQYPNDRPVDILFSPHHLYCDYTWWRHKDPTRRNTGNNNYYPTYRSDDYFVHVTDYNYCQRVTTTFVKFLNALTREGKELDKSETTK